MSPSDKNKSTGNSTSGEGQSQLCSESCEMDFSPESTSPSTSNVTLSGHGTIVNIPWVTASQSTIKCSVNDQMKTFDPGDNVGIERLISTSSGNTVLLGKSSSSNLIKNSNKNYKAGSKINKLADMLAKRSQNVVEVKENTTSDTNADDNCAPKVNEETVVIKSVSNDVETKCNDIKSKSNDLKNKSNDLKNKSDDVESISNDVKSINGSCFENTINDKESKLFSKCRRKSVPNQSCSPQEWQLHSTSKSCSDLSGLFPVEENEKTILHALRGSTNKLQTDESTKKKVVRKNSKNAKSPPVIPERRRRSSRSDALLNSSKITEKPVDDSPQTESTREEKETVCENISSPEETNHSDICTRKKGKMKQRKSKRLVESSTQTADIEFISVIKRDGDTGKEVPADLEGEEKEEVETKKHIAVETDNPREVHNPRETQRLKIVTYECLYCTQTFTVWSLCKAHEKTHTPRKYKQFRCQYCSKKLFSLEEFKNHCIQKHRNKYAYCKKCDFRFSTKDELYSHNKEIHLKKKGDSQSTVQEESSKPVQETEQVEKEDADEKADKKVEKSKVDSKMEEFLDSNKTPPASPKNIQSKTNHKIDDSSEPIPKSPKNIQSKTNVKIDEPIDPTSKSPVLPANILTKSDPKIDEAIDSTKKQSASPKNNQPKADEKIDESFDSAKESFLPLENIQSKTEPKIDDSIDPTKKSVLSPKNLQSKVDQKISSSIDTNKRPSSSRNTQLKSDEKIDSSFDSTKKSCTLRNLQSKLDHKTESIDSPKKPCVSPRNIDSKAEPKIDDSIDSNKKSSPRSVQSKTEQKTDTSVDPKSTISPKNIQSKTELQLDSVDETQKPPTVKNIQSKAEQKIDSPLELKKSSTSLRNTQSKIDDSTDSTKKVTTSPKNVQSKSDIKIDAAIDSSVKSITPKIIQAKIDTKLDTTIDPTKKSSATLKNVQPKTDPKIDDSVNLTKRPFASPRNIQSKTNPKNDIPMESNKKSSTCRNSQSKSDLNVDVSSSKKSSAPARNIQSKSDPKVDVSTDSKKSFASPRNIQFKTDLKVDVSFDSTKKSSVSPRYNQKCSPKENKTEEQLLEMEMLFYSHLSGNIQENLTNHLDGKLDQSGNPVRTDRVVEVPDGSKSSSLLSVATPSAGAPDVQISRAPSPYQTRSKTPNPLPPTAKKFKKLPNWQQKFWEKYNFPTNYRYEHRFWDKNYLNTEKSAFYLKDLSCLDIKTQLTMRENIKKLDEIKKIEENTKPVDELKFPDYLSLIPRTNKVKLPESRVELQKSSECGKSKKQIGKEDTKKSFKSPGGELPIGRGRSKASLESDRKGSSEGLKMVTRRQSSLELVKEDREEKSKKRKGSLDLSGGQRTGLRRQTSLDNVRSSSVPKADQNLSNLDLDNSPLSPTGSTEISGEWVRPRSYLCGTCCTKFTNLWELEDHKWVSHPNVWCTHYEFEDDKIDKLFQKNEGVGESSEMSKSKLTDLYKRYLLPHGYLKTAKLVPKTNFPEECTKCKKNCMNSSEMHKHMLDCGGDTTWFLTMYSSPMTIKRKWRPFGSRRKKQIGRRDVKRNIPSTPTLRAYHYQHKIRTKPGDVETIQKMLANLPEKRARRAINFDEIKTRSQATIHSNRLLRKRFKSTFSNNFLKLKNIKQKRQLKQGKNAGSSKSATDTSSENTPVGSPKRRNKLKENLQLLKEDNSRDGSSENSEEVNKVLKKKVQKKKDGFDPQKKNEVVRMEKTKIKKEVLETSQEKPTTRSNGVVGSVENKTKRKTAVIKEEILDLDSRSSSPVEAKQIKLDSKSGKKTKKSKMETVGKKEAAVSESDDITSNVTTKGTEKGAKKLKLQEEPEEGNSPHWVNAHCNPILRLKQNSKAKNELLKSIKKKVKNSRKILEKKETEKTEEGSRRSLRIKSLQQSETDTEPPVKEIPDNSKKIETVVIEKDMRMKTVIVSLENAVPVNTPYKNPKTVIVKGEKEVFEEISPVIRRSLRNSVSLEDKQEIVKSVDSSSIVSFNPRSLLRRNLKNEKMDSPATSDTVTPKAVSVIQKTGNVRNMMETKPVTQVSLLKKNNFPNPRAILKPEEVTEMRRTESNKSLDLEEMPILAKVEPIHGKMYGKTEKEIPVLMPVGREQKRKSNEDEQLSDNSVSFQVIKKRRKNPKEITTLKIIKKVENGTPENRNGNSFRIQSDESMEEDSDAVKNKKKKLSDTPIGKSAEKKVKTDVKKYFLGIDPNEIDKGRCDGQDESGSDNEPLICLVNSQNECRKEELKKEIEIEKEDSHLPTTSETVVKTSDCPPEQPITVPDEKLCCSTDNTQTISQMFRKTFKLKKKIKMMMKKKKDVTPEKELRMTVTLKEPTLKIVKKSFSSKSKWSTKMGESKKEEIIEVPSNPEYTSESPRESFLPERRSRRISKETKSTNEFVIDDPLILVDELWSDLDSDSDSSKRKSRKGKKKLPKKKANDDKRMSDVNLEELLRNFGENKDTKKTGKPNQTIKIIRKRSKISNTESRRKAVEKRKRGKSFNRLSLKLFRFNKNYKNFGNRGVKLSEAKRALQEKLDELQARSSNTLPDLPFLAAEIKENPVQVIQCGAKPAKKTLKKVDSKFHNSNIHLKISLPLEAINSVPVFNNNHLTAPITDEPVAENVLEKEANETVEAPEKEIHTLEDEPLIINDDAKNKSKRSDVIDKIFYCEICQTYYYSSSQLKIHKLSNRHKLKESELQQSSVQSDVNESVKIETSEPVPVVENILPDPPSKIETVEIEKLNEDTLEMPTLEGPFIEENSFPRVTAEPVQATPPPVNTFGFSQESLKDIQKAIGCTDEEMLILTLLGENTIEIENDILDLDSCKTTQTKSSTNPKEKEETVVRENEKTNGTFKVDLKQRMTSALACLVNKAVFNLLQKYENAAKTAVNPEALSLLGKLSNLSRRKNVLQLNELLKKRNDGETSVSALPKEIERKEPTLSYKYQCTICGNRFEKASTRECHISRSHRGKAKKLAEDVQSVQAEDDWNDSWSYDVGDDHLGSTTTPQFWCSDCGINFLSPQEVLEHQKMEHQTGLKDADQTKEGPLQSSTIGSSDEILEGKKSRRRPKLFSSEELNQQRIIANNELRKLDRKFSNKSKNSKIKWGMDALKFTVEKENKAIVDEEEKEIVSEDSLKAPMDVKNIDLVPKLNLSRISNIPEFKVIQKNSFENRFQKIIDNKLKRKCVYPSQEENATDDVEEEVMLVPVVVKKKTKKQKLAKCSKKENAGKPRDVYDFNESESEGEPAVYSHIKKPAAVPMKIKLVKEKEGPSKNKADSTTKDLAPDDYDSEDSLPLSVVKKSKPGEEDDEKDEKTSDDGVEKSDGILEQVEYLIEQLENETGSLKNETVAQVGEYEQDFGEKDKKSEFSKENPDLESKNESVRVSVANKFLEMDHLLKNQKSKEKKVVEEKVEESLEQENESILAEPESSQSTFDEEDSIPLVLISKKVEKKCDENTTDVSTTASEDVSLSRVEEDKGGRTSPGNTQLATEESLPPVFSSSENDGAFSEKSDKPFENLNGNVIYCRNDSMTDFDSDLSNDGLIDSNYGKNCGEERNFIKEITEKEDVVIVCSKRGEEDSNDSKPRKDSESPPVKDTEEKDVKKKKRFPLLTATIEENNFRRSESPKSNKEVIVRKIWSRKKLPEDSTDNDEDSCISLDNNTSFENLHEDESRTEIDKEIIVKKIWSRKRPEHEEDLSDKVEEKFEDMKINQTEVSDEVVIKCGPKTKSSPKRRKSRNSNEASKERIMRKIWSGKCAFQTKAALKTYEYDMLSNCKENEAAERQSKSKRRRRGSALSGSKRSKLESEKDDEDDDLDSLLEEIEREQLEKAIRSEFLQLRRSEKGSVEMKESGTPTVGIFAETTVNPRKEDSEKKRRKIKKKIKHPKQSLLKRKKIIRKPFRRVLPSEERNVRDNLNRICLDETSENSLDKNIQLFRGDAKAKNRKHKKHRHKHHHHKHKHKKSKHHKSAMSKHKSKHEFEEKGNVEGDEDSFTILEKICQEIPTQIESESRRPSSDTNDVDSKVVEVFSVESKTSESPTAEFESEVSGKKRFESTNIYEFVEDVSDFSSDGLRNLKKVN